MATVVIKRAKNKFSILCEDKGLIFEDVSAEEVEEYFTSEFRKRFWNLCQPISCTDLQYAVFTGKIACCDCGEKVTTYNEFWKESNQRCSKCLG
jgi:hypothetical protein